MENKEGIIQRIKSDRKALAIENEWYNSFKPLDDSIKVGQEVKLVYSLKGDFKNIKSLNQIKNETKNLPQENEGLFNLTATDKNCILMCATDLATEFKNIPFRDWVQEVNDIRDKL
jgi:hypothetical protein